MTRARDLADSADKDIVGTLTLDGLDVAGNVSVDGGTIKLDGNYPVGTGNVALGNTALDSNVSGNANTAIGNNAYCNSEHYCWYLTIPGALGVQVSLKRNTYRVKHSSLVGSHLISNTTAQVQHRMWSYRRLRSNTTAYSNTAVGYQSLYANTIGYKQYCRCDGCAGSQIPTGSWN